jgi:hypothetical protein
MNFFFSKEMVKGLLKEVNSSWFPSFAGYGMVETIIKIVLNRWIYRGTSNIPPSDKAEQEKKDQWGLYEIKEGQYIIRPKGTHGSPPLKICPNDVHRETFHLRAGSSLGRRPRPDTYNI